MFNFIGSENILTFMFSYPINSLSASCIIPVLLCQEIMYDITHINNNYNLILEYFLVNLWLTSRVWYDHEPKIQNI